ncbi:hypothetical protein O5O45_23000 [Hahella aquimaris]|uniref:hypothetical protein n=1 Tax=Hahella sp. HNIBRBA332 TaxID=3015983 RepID=UPI00273C8EF0|nr:hypothetical protein [Hahella sp. HNIBRBA332]WLQ12599.1 hypothetical protein O5O45_23000 [Hahella sp. HNIBRBA332]
MRQTLVRWISIVVATAAFIMPTAGYSETVEEKPSALAMTGDALFARPVLFGITVIGSVVYVASLPFSALGGNAGEAAETLVIGPAKTTFVRCLGCTRVGRKEKVVTLGDESAQN